MGALYGGAAGLIWIRGRRGAWTGPLDPEAILPGASQGLYILDRWCGIAPEAGLVRSPGSCAGFYTIRLPATAHRRRVHHKPDHPFLGRELPCLERQAEQEWGASEVESLYREVCSTRPTHRHMAAPDLSGPTWT